jgi:uncharacterized protein (TIGR03663 family)
VPRLTTALLVLAAAAVRLIFLEWRPTHFDEGINGYFVNQLWAKGYADYDPSNYHGPLYFYYLQLAEILLGRGIFAFRFATALLATAIVYVAALHARYLGRAAYWAAAILAVSPAFVFYGRYAIHESLLILCQVCFSYGFLAWHYDRSRHGWLLMLAGVFGSVATKETFFIFFGCWVIALALVRALGRFVPAQPAPIAREQAPLSARPSARWRMQWALLLGAATLALFSGFLLDPSGIVDMARALALWTNTGTGSSAHAKPFVYWLELLGRHEWPLLLGLVLGTAGSLVGSTWMRVFSATGCGLWLAYSIIPYKTPWNIIGLWPLAFVAVSAATMVRLNFRDFSNLSEPYVYVHTTNDLNTVLRLIERRVEVAPEDQAMPIRVWIRDSWPLPWLLSLYPDLGYGTFAPGMPIDGAVVLLDGREQVAFETALQTPYLRIPFHLRDAYPAGFAYFEQSRFDSVVPDGAAVVGGNRP